MNYMRFRKFLRYFKIYFFVIFFVVGLIVIVRNISDQDNPFNYPNFRLIQEFGLWKFFFIANLFLTLWVAFLSSLIDLFILPKLFYKRSLSTVLFIGFIVQLILITLITIVIRDLIQILLSQISQSEIEAPPSAIQILPLIITLIFSILISRIFIEIDRKLGPGNLWKMLTGKFYRPREEERIFMFIDLQDSTPIAEKLGHIEFSKLLKDCYHDFAIVDDYRAEIYQYVGDEVVISWPLIQGFKNNNFLKAFFAFDGLLSKRAEYYEKQYGVKPFFKSGANMGPVVVTEVGEIKREITYHGDTLNTAARIQGMCNELKSQMLIPEGLYEMVKDTREFTFEDVGSTKLKGKEKEVRLYKVTEA